jgi:hypothetical protein
LPESCGPMWMTWCAKSSAGCIPIKMIPTLPAAGSMSQSGTSLTEDEACRGISG